MRHVSALLALAIALGGVPAAADTASAAEPSVTRLAVVVPLTVPPQPTGLIPTESLENYTSPTGILTRTLDAVAGEQVAIAIDPMVIASIRILGNTAPQSATDWLEQLRGLDNETFALSYADTDLAALSQAGSTTVLAPTSFPIDPNRHPAEETGESEATETPSASETAPPLPIGVPTSETITNWPYTLDNILWPRPNTVTAADLATFNAETPVTTILSSGNVTATPGTSATVGDNSVLVVDEGLTRLVSESLAAFTPVDWRAAIDRLSAELERKPAGRTILAAVDRTTVASPRLEETVTALAGLDVAELAPLSSAQAESASPVRVADIPVDAERVSRIRLLLAAEARIVPFSSILVDPEPLTGERRLSLLALSSNAWVEPETVWVTTVDEWLEQANEILTSVQIAESSTINFFQDKGTLPIAVSNNLPYPVTVYVTVRSSTGILVVVKSRVPIEVPAESQARAFIPVQSIANGRASLQTSLSSESKVPIGSTHTLTANVVAGWETTATFVVAALLVLLFVAGIVRTVLKRRRTKSLATESDRDTHE